MGAKLVRDRMGDIPWGDEYAKKYLRPVRDHEEFLALLKSKLLEEVGELLGAIDKGEPVAMEEEFGDVVTTIAGLGALLSIHAGVDLNRMEQACDRKVDERGGFEEGLVFDFHHYMA